MKDKYFFKEGCAAWSDHRYEKRKIKPDKFTPGRWSKEGCTFEKCKKYEQCGCPWVIKRRSK